VKHDEHDHQQRDVAVQRVDREPRPARRGREPDRPKDPSTTLAVSSTIATVPVDRVRYQ
jgi:hypothetical protein